MEKEKKIKEEIKKNKKKLSSGLTYDEEVELAEKIKLLWRFIWSLKPYRDNLEKIAEDAEERASFVVSAAVLNPTGWEVAEKKHKRVARRARLLVEMMDCLEETDKEVLKAESKKKAIEEISEMFNF